MKKRNYRDLSNIEKKNIKEKYYLTESGKINKKRFNRLLIYGLLCLIYALVLVLDAIINKAGVINYIFASFMFIFALIFLIGREKVLIRNINSFLKKNK